MRAADAGLSLTQWVDSFLPDNPEEERVMAAYANSLMGDNRFRALMNHLEAASVLEIHKAKTDDAVLEAKRTLMAIQSLRGAIRARAAASLVERTKSPD